MKRVLILGAAGLLTATGPAPMASAETIECASEVPAAPRGHWYYRIIDGRKCWYQGKPMMPKSSLSWTKPSVAEVKTAAPEQPAETPTTDGRSIAISPPVEAPAWPAPVANDLSFESRWLGLRSGN
jgi:hypothetical protein